MASLGKHFLTNQENLISDEKAVFKGVNYRISVLSERLIRFEYSSDGFFYDGATEQVKNRKFAVPKIKVEQDQRFLAITTKYFILQYDKEKPFKTVNLISGVILLVSGIILIVYKSLLENVIAIIIGVIMIVNSVSKIEYTLTLRDNEVPAWVISMVFSIITLLLGIFFVVNTFKAMNLLTKTLGLIIIIYAVIDIIEITVLKFKLKKAMNKVDDNIKIIDEK